LQRGQERIDAPLSAGCASAAPQCGQNLLPRNARPKHVGQEIVASRAPQYWHCVASDDTTPPQFGQLRVPTGITICCLNMFLVDFTRL
jgi:hypothetical protein